MGLFSRYSKEAVLADINKFVSVLSEEDFNSLKKSGEKAWKSVLTNPDGIPSKESMADFISVCNILQTGKKTWYHNMLPQYLTSNERYEMCVYIFFAVNDR